MKIQLKGNRKLCILGAVIMMILVVEAVVLIALTIAYGQDYKKAKLQDSVEVQTVLSEIENEEVKGLFFSMFSLDSYDVNDFYTYRGLNTAILEEPLETGEDVLNFLKLALSREHDLDVICVGLRLDSIIDNGFARVLTDVCKWDDELSELVKANPQIYFHIILEYPSAYELADMSGLKRTRLLKWYDDMAELFTPQEEYRNMLVSAPAAESWLAGNRANYLENGEPNEDAAGYVLGQIICMDSYALNRENKQEKLMQIENMIKEAKEHVALDEGYTYVFFGDSVIGNYTDSMSVPGAVQGFTKGKVINCGYGGLHAAKEDSESISLADVIDAFLEGNYEHFEDNKTVKTGIPEFYRQLSEINREKLIFFIGVGLNDYMSARPLTGEQENQLYNYEGAVHYAVERLQEAYPTSEIILLTPNYIGLFEHGTEIRSGYMLEDLVNSMEELSRELDIKCVDIYHGLDINADNINLYLADKCHPNEIGRYKIGKLVYEHLVKWSLGEGSVEKRDEP